MDLRPPVADQWLRSNARSPVRLLEDRSPKKTNVQQGRCSDWTAVIVVVQGQGGPSNERLLRRQLLRQTLSPPTRPPRRRATAPPQTEFRSARPLRRSPGAAPPPQSLPRFLPWLAEHVVAGDVQGGPGDRQVRRLRLRARRAHLPRRHRLQDAQEAHGPRTFLLALLSP